ncbi:hypothetical protein D3C78_1620710 [compost metagenome]
MDMADVVLLLQLRGKALHGLFFDLPHRSDVQQQIGAQRAANLIKHQPHIDLRPAPPERHGGRGRARAGLVVRVNLPGRRRDHHLGLMLLEQRQHMRNQATL